LRTCRRMARKLETDLERIGKRLKEIRASKGYTSYRQFAYTFEIEPKSVWRLEEGKSDFKYSSLKRMLDAFNMTVEEFFNSL
jgi:transcriptional regulator with XRE-family HTH domain